MKLIRNAKATATGHVTKQSEIEIRREKEERENLGLTDRKQNKVKTTENSVGGKKKGGAHRLRVLSLFF